VALSSGHLDTHTTAKEKKLWKLPTHYFKNGYQRVKLSNLKEALKLRILGDCSHILM